MDSKNPVIKSLKKDHLIQELVLMSTPVPVLVYFVIKCFPFAKEQPMTLIGLTLIAVSLSGPFALLVRKYALRTLSKIYQKFQKTA